MDIADGGPAEADSDGYGSHAGKDNAFHADNDVVHTLHIAGGADIVLDGKSDFQYRPDALPEQGKESGRS